ncbi:MSHA biogenesis protein MshQ [Grimontia indica]|uniref:MSHA biogenesis protein MshQ n=2 Tax=Grimontia indica TaxID=1056512 RepID=R1IYJ0_9GAMM|nr:MSHA biogenesis protein MshQ [Grimontia indica]
MRILLAIGSLLFTSILWASSNGIYFPGPAQAPNIIGYANNCGQNNQLPATSCLQINSNSTIYQPEENPVRVGFEELFHQHPSTCNAFGGAIQNDCVNTGEFAADKGLKVLKPKSQGGNLDEITYPLDGTQYAHHSFNSDTANYTKLTLGQYSTATFEPGVYYFGDLVLNQYVSATVTGPIEIHVNSLKLGNNVKFNVQGDSQNVIFWVHERESGNDHYSAHIGADSVLHGYVYSVGSVKLAGSLDGSSWGTTIYGAITAKSLELANRSIIKFGGFLDSHNLKIDPLLASTNACSRIPVTFKITNDEGETQSEISGELTASATNFLDTACWATSADGTCSNGPVRAVNLNNGQRKLWLQNKAVGTVKVVASFKSDKTGELESEDSGNYTFTAGGFRFSPSPLKMVAGKPEKLTIEAVYGDCDPTPIPEYDGTKQLSVGNASYQQPNYTSTRAPHKPSVNGIVGARTIDVEFSKGVAKDALTLNYSDAGVLSIPISEVQSANATSSDSPTEVEEDSKGVESRLLNGDISLHARPYTFAVCGSLPSLSDVSSQKAFVKAGNPFTATLKPVVWQSGDLTGTALTNGGVVPLKPNFCGRATTPSFWHQNAPAATVTLDETAYIVTPANGSNAAITGIVPLAHTETNNASDVNNVRYRFVDVSVDEVGAFGVRSKLAANYLDMTVNPGERPLGRFYPSHFSVSGSLTSAITASEDSGGDGFTYLNQPFDGQYTVYAMTAGNKPVKNYHLFGDAYKAGFEDWVIKPVSSNPIAGDDLSSRWTRPSKTNWRAGNDGTSQLSLTQNIRMRVDKDSAPEAPFRPLYFAVGVSKPDIDGTDFRFCDVQNEAGCEIRVIKPAGEEGSSIAGAEFAKEEFMFGRMRIEGFTETHDFSSEQIMPVAVEVFDGSRFVTNTRDNASFVSTTIGEKEVLFSSSPDANQQAKISLKDDAGNTINTKTVENGRSEFVVKAPVQNGNLNREQFRYWQRLDRAIGSAAPQTWLQHNWQGTQFDDDPSAIGTFGFYRGSDRVIYKGEKNITLTGE